MDNYELAYEKRGRVTPHVPKRKLIGETLLPLNLMTHALILLVLHHDGVHLILKG